LAAARGKNGFQLFNFWHCNPRNGSVRVPLFAEIVRVLFDRLCALVVNCFCNVGFGRFTSLGLLDRLIHYPSRFFLFLYAGNSFTGRSDTFFRMDICGGRSLFLPSYNRRLSLDWDDAWVGNQVVCAVGDMHNFTVRLKRLSATHPASCMFHRAPTFLVFNRLVAYRALIHRRYAVADYSHVGLLGIGGGLQHVLGVVCAGHLLLPQGHTLRSLYHRLYRGSC
jgi:hypothetical protein